MSEYIAKCNEVVGISGKTLIVPDYIDTSEEIVRCKDCRYYKQREAISPPMVCERWGYHNFKTEPERFCSWAERREQ